MLVAGAHAQAQVYRPVAPGSTSADPTWSTSVPLQAKPAPAKRTALQPRLQPGVGGLDARAIEEAANYTIQTDPPGPERLFRLESEAELLERIRQQGRQLKQQDADIFPEEAPVSTEPYAGRHWPPSHRFAEPGYVCYQRLLFEERNSERYGWDLGAIQPVVSLGHFWKSFVTMPYHAASRPHCCFDCSSGYCLPGDPIPYLLYPPEISLSGAIAEAGVVGGLFAIFP